MSSEQNHISSVSGEKQKKDKNTISAEDERRKRQRRAAKRRKRVMAGGDDRLKSITGEISKDEWKKKEQTNLNDPTNIIFSPSGSTSSLDGGVGIRDRMNNESNPFQQFMSSNTSSSNMAMPDLSSLNQMFSGMSSEDMSNIGNMGNMGNMDQMMQNMFGSLLGNNGNMNTSQQTSKLKKEEDIKKYNKYAHFIFCLLFVIFLVIIPYDLSIFNYNLSSDTWTFFITFELILLSGFYGYQQWFDSNNNDKQINNQQEMGNQLMQNMQFQMFDALLGTNGLISTWLGRAKMVWSYIKMIRQLISDLCLILFLWIILTYTKTLVV